MIERGAPPGPRQPDMRRGALTSAAAELFIARGIAATTIDDIAARAGLSKGSFYHYFRTKSEILTAVRRRFGVEFRNRVAATVERRSNVSWADKLEAWVEGMAEAYFDLQPLHDVLFHGTEDPHRESVSEYLTVQYLVELLSSGMSAGAWFVQDPRAAAAIMFCGLHGAVDEALIAGTPRERVAKAVAPLFLQMVGIDGRRSSRNATAQPSVDRSGFTWWQASAVRLPPVQPADAQAPERDFRFRPVAQIIPPRQLPPVSGGGSRTVLRRR